MSDGNDGAGGRDEPAARNDEARVAQAERVAGAINVVKWIVVATIALATLSLALVVGFGSLDSEEPTTVRARGVAHRGRPGPTRTTSSPSRASRTVPAPRPGSSRSPSCWPEVRSQALLVWIAFGWAQHTLGMLAILARRRVT